jgi:hypothetical protein
MRYRRDHDWDLRDLLEFLSRSWRGEEEVEAFKLWE